MQAPTTTDLLNHPVVRQALEDGWVASLAGDPVRRHEEGGWIFMDTAMGTIAAHRAPPGGRALLDLNTPPLIAGSVVVATFHTHPNPTAEGWDPGASAGDTQSAWLLGVPCLIRVDYGVHTTGP